MPAPASEVVPGIGAALIGGAVPLFLRRRRKAQVLVPTQRYAPVVDERQPKLLNTMRDELWLLDEDNLRLRFLNKAALDRSGLPADAYRGIPLDTLLNTERHEALFSALTAGEEMPRACLLRLGGTSFEVTLQRFTPTGEGPQILVTMHDISDRMAHEQMKADFVSTVSHELRSPLTSIKGSMGLLLSNAAGDLPKPARGLLEIAHRNAERLVLIINDILDLEKIVQGGMEFDVATTDLSAVVREAVVSSAVFLQRFDIEVDVVGGEEPIIIDTDANRILQVLNNLLTNAAKFSKPGSTVKIVIDTVGEFVRVSVVDEGVGIPEEEQHKVFQRFSDMSNSDRPGKGGTGLGLSICKAIVESLGGTIGFSSQEGRGTTFYFLLALRDNRDKSSDEIIELRTA